MADLNNDGVPDIAVVNQGLPTTRESSLSVLLGNGDGSFQPAVTTDVLTGSNSVAVGDLNGDGLPDVALTSSVNHTVELLLGNGDGSFQSGRLVFSVGRNPTSVAVGDFDGNGALDLATANSRSDTVSLLLGNGDGSFRSRIDFPVGRGPTSVTGGDFNGDGIQDLVTANFTSNSVSVLLSNGDGSFQQAQGFATGPGPREVALADFDGDGTLDLAVGESSGLQFSVSVLAGNGDGTFRAAGRIETGLLFTSLAAGDFSGDGIPDLAMVGPLVFHPQVAVFAGNGDGSFQDPQFFATGGSSPFGLTAGDLNADGLADLIVANTFSNTVAILLQEAPPAPPATISTLFTGEQDGVDLDVNFVLSSLGKASPPPFDVDGGSIVNTDHGPFTLGTGPFTATFGGDGRVFHSGIAELYRFAEGGRNFFGVRGRGVGVITFDGLPAESVTIFARGTNDTLVSPLEQDLDGDGITDFFGFGPLGNAIGVLRAFAPDGSILDEIPLSNTQLQEITIRGKGPVGFITLTNLSRDANSFAVIAGFTATAVPQAPSSALVGPGPSASLAIGGDAVIRRRRTR